MAIKSSITTTINGFITALITQVRVRNAFSTLLDNFYPTVVLDTQDTTNIFTKVDDDFEYDIKTAKIGRLVNICGSLTNVSGSAISGENFCTITDTEYRTATAVVNHYIPAISESGLIVFIGVGASTLSVVGTAPDGEKFYFNGCYTVKD